jgi:uncharacterized protein (TIRG00374 family)
MVGIHSQSSDRLPTAHSHLKIGLSLVVIVAAYVIVPQLKDFKDSLHSLVAARPGLIVAAIGASLLTSVLAALTYQLVALKRLRYYQNLIVQLASLFTNHLLPAGLGGMSVSYRYLKNRRHTTAQATVVVIINDLLGLVGHLLLIGIFIVLFHLTAPALTLGRIHSGPVIVGLLLLVFVLAIIASRPTLQRKIVRSLRRLQQALTMYRHRKLALLSATLTSAALTLSNVACLYLCARAVAIPLAASMCLVIFTAGVVVGTAAPTPGGLGGFEAGLLAGMLSYHVPSGPALAAVLLFRLITYWLALIIGAIAFISVGRAKLLS